MPFTKYRQTKTLKNLENAFIKECEGAIKYQYFADQAKKDGFQQVAQIFLDAAHNEKEHAEIWFKELKMLGNTEQNLQQAISGEEEESKSSGSYTEYSRQATRDGFPALATLFEEVGQIELFHKNRFKEILKLMQKKQLLKKPEDRVWICRNCGKMVVGKEPPAKCPVCGHDRGYYELFSEEF